MSHNKRRNSCFVYEALSREATKHLINKDLAKAREVFKLIREYFSKDKILYKELELYTELKEASLEDESLAGKILQEVKRKYDSLDKKEIFNEQTKLINAINKGLGPKVFENYVSNYKHLATVNQILSSDLKAKEKVLLEGNLIKSLVKRAEKEENKVDNTVYNIFVKKFNQQYGSKLLSEQKELLGKFINSNNDEGNLEFKIYLNEELGRLKAETTKAMQLEEVKSDKNMLLKTQKLLEFLDSFKTQQISKETLEKVMKIQEFVSEAKKND